MLHLPLACMGKEVGLKLGSSVGKVEEVDTDKDGIGWGEYLRVKVLIDLSKPLPRGRKLKFEGEIHWIVFQYERLPKFCFQCGIISHGPEGCMKRSSLRNQGTKVEFGPWMRASSPTRRVERTQVKFTAKHGAGSDHENRRGMEGWHGNGRRRFDPAADNEESRRTFRETRHTHANQGNGSSPGVNRGRDGHCFNEEIMMNKERNAGGTQMEYFQNLSTPKIATG